MARERIRRAVRGTALTVAGAQAVVVGGLIATDAWRKRVRPHQATWPRTPPADLDVGGSSLRVYTDGEALYGDMLEAIARAEHRVLFESFIVKGDAVGLAFRSALMAAAARGVEVLVIYDGFANLVVRPSFFDFGPDVHVVRYPALRPGALALNVRKSGRDHRKLLVVDGEVGFVGGYNVGGAYATEWRDTHLRVSGPSAWELENAFVDFWNQMRAEHQPLLRDGGSPHWEPRLRVYRNVPAQLIYPIRGVYMEAIDRAQHRISLTQPYFIPDGELLASLLAAAGRGVQVRILMPEASNHVVADWLARGFYAALLEGGVELWLYQDAMVHAKTATIDGVWSTIGTANIDRLSLTGNYEVNVEVFDGGLAAHLERIFATDLTNARQLTAEEWHARPVAAKSAELLLAPLRPLL
jgi:cardiolipin synthase A/B